MMIHLDLNAGAVYKLVYKCLYKLGYIAFQPQELHYLMLKAPC